MAAALALLAASAAPVSAGFRYVPPAEVEAAAEPAAKGTVAGGEDMEPSPGPGQAVSGQAVSGQAVSGQAVSGAGVSGAGVSGTSVWRVRAGETLRGVLARWGVRAGADVVFLTDRRYRLEGAASFGGEFAQATQALFEALGHLPHPPEGAVSANGRSLAVTHRVSAANHGGTVP